VGNDRGARGTTDPHRDRFAPEDRLKAVLEVELDRLRLPTPVMIASGCFTSSRELAGLLDIKKVGGIVTRSITGTSRKGSPTPRMAETSSGLLWETGLQNPGAEGFVRELTQIVRLGVPVLASVAGTSTEEYSRVAVILGEVGGLSGLEVNLSSVDAERGVPFAWHRDLAAEAVAAVARASRLPVIAKLSAETAAVVDIARACIEAGAEGLTLINSISGMAVNPATGRAKLAAITGGLSGPAIRPIAVRTVFEVASALPSVPILGCGGVADATAALEFLCAGAWAVQMGTVMFANPAAPVEAALGILSHLRDRGFSSPAELREQGQHAGASPGG
jgi:dihydroorotate dehydrogenase (NAD+) catalytic subunit